MLLLRLVLSLVGKQSGIGEFEFLKIYFLLLSSLFLLWGIYDDQLEVACLFVFFNEIMLFFRPISL